MKFSIILIVAGIIIMIIGGIVLMDNAQANNNHTNSAQINNGQGGSEDRFKPRLVDLDAAAQAANNAGKPRLPTVSPIEIIFIGVVMIIVGLYDARRTSLIEKKPPG